MITNSFKNHRKALGLTQQKLAELAAVSLPTIQNIENGIGNPSLDILVKISQALGQRLSMEPLPVDWETLSYLGVPLHSVGKKQPLPRNFSTFLLKVRPALVAYENPKNSDRKIEALAATLLALKTHWPSLFNQLGPLKENANKLIGEQDLARLLKLRSLAISNLQAYL